MKDEKKMYRKLSGPNGFVQIAAIPMEYEIYPETIIAERDRGRRIWNGETELTTDEEINKVLQTRSEERAQILNKQPRKKSEFEQAIEDSIQRTKDKNP